MEGASSSIIMLVVLIAVFYFMLIRPENKRKKKAQEMRDSLKKGDTITTIGGIVARSSWSSRTPSSSRPATTGFVWS